MSEGSNILVEVHGLKKHFPILGGVFRKTVGAVRAVDGIRLYVPRGETLGLVGESGCGKTTAGRLILRLIEPTAGEIYFEGKDILKLSDRELRELRRNMQMIFQDPMSSLNPRMTVKNIVGEPLIINNIAKGNELRERVLSLIQKVGLNPDHLNRFPHEFSGGQRQRIGIARALALNPKFIVLDEPTSSLDVSVQAQILNLLQDLQNELGLTYLFISHNLSVIRHMSSRIAVMYLGKVVEIAAKHDLLEKTAHPYTQALFSAIPIPNPDLKRSRIVLKGDVPSPSNPPPGCRFHPRCIHAGPRCSKEEPDLLDIGGEHLVACHIYHDGVGS